MSVPRALDDRIREALTAAGVSEPVALADHPRSGRNQIVEVTGDGRAWIAKRTQAPAEAWFAATVAPSVSWAPRCVPVEDPDLVIVERLTDAATVHELAGSDPDAALDALVDLAEPLAELHAWPTDDDTPPCAAALPELDPVNVVAVIDATEPAREVLRRLHRRDALREAMRRTYVVEEPIGLIHGDLKSDNVLVAAGTPTLIDWELCGTGPLAWDLGSVVGSMLAMWVDSADLDAPDAGAWLAGAAVPYEQVADASRRFTERYRVAARGPVPDPGAIAAAAATWLVARAWAESLQRLTVDPRLLLRLVVAEGAVRHPARLLGGRPTPEAVGC